MRAKTKKATNMKPIAPSPEFVRIQKLGAELDELKAWFAAHPVPVPPKDPLSIDEVEAMSHEVRERIARLLSK